MMNLNIKLSKSVKETSTKSLATGGIRTHDPQVAITAVDQPRALLDFSLIEPLLKSSNDGCPFVGSRVPSSGHKEARLRGVKRRRASPLPRRGQESRPDGPRLFLNPEISNADIFIRMLIFLYVSFGPSHE